MPLLLPCELDDDAAMNMRSLLSQLQSLANCGPIKRFTASSPPGGRRAHSPGPRASAAARRRTESVTTTYVSRLEAMVGRNESEAVKNILIGEGANKLIAGERGRERK